jgi:trans-2,3-dihydro-3-hydroxyanthranilate isomerase
MRAYRFFQVDVFTDVPFGGNPLAVVPEAEGLSDEEMEKIAREMNLSETTFVLPPTDPKADYRVRFFTPGGEIPFAGHPTLGTHYVLAQLGRYDLTEPLTRVYQEIGVGVLPVDLYAQGGEVQRVVMTQARPTFHATLDDVSSLAEALGVAAEEIAATGWPVQVVSTGMPQMLVPVRSLAAVQGVRPSAALLEEVCRRMETDCAMLFTFETLFPRSTVHTRMFAPMMGVWEDPATGSASGALGAYLVHHRAVEVQEPTTTLISEQGYEIHRPSTIYIEVDSRGGEIEEVRVGGQVVSLIEGVIRF